MKLTKTLATLVTSAALLTNASSASAFGWNMDWFDFSYSAGGIVLNGTSIHGENPQVSTLGTLTSYRIISVTPPAPAGPIRIPYPNLRIGSK